MNLVKGKAVDRAESLKVIGQLPELVIHTIQTQRLLQEQVLDGCQRLSELLVEEEAAPLLMKLGSGERKARQQVREAKQMLGREYLEKKLAVELGAVWDPGTEVLEDGTRVVLKLAPLGTLLHIAAGNMDGLAAFSVIEGLLAGNINILKLPGEGDILSGFLLESLIGLVPSLAEFIYVFDFPSSDIRLMKQMAEAADAVVIWGGEDAVQSVRSMVRPDTAIIEWGHKLSFAYVTEQGLAESSLRKLAAHICDTDQLLCSSCQVIYVDTKDLRAMKAVARKFLRILEEEGTRWERALTPAMEGQITLKLRTIALAREAVVYRGENCSVEAARGTRLEQAVGYRNVWVKCLPAEEIISCLRPYKGKLQTAGLLCGSGERDHLTGLLVRAGVVCVTDEGHMSALCCGMAHDGMFALRRYTKIVTAVCPAQEKAEGQNED